MKNAVRLISVVSIGILVLFGFRMVLDLHRLQLDIQIKESKANLWTPNGSARSFTRGSKTDADHDLGCLTHKSISMKQSESGNVGSDPSKTVLEHFNATRCGRLKRNWLHNPPLSDYAKKIEAHQSNCSIPLATHHFDNTFGLGSHMVLWGQAMCNSMEEKYRMRSHAPNWIWMDHEHCDMQVAALSPTLCYFPASEYKCSPALNKMTSSRAETGSIVVAQSDIITPINATDPRREKLWCALVRESEESKAMVRASSTEYLFQRLSPLVIREAQRQVGIIFPDGVVPEDLVTVHIRWGDKFWEMDLPPIQEYIDAVNAILAGKNILDNDNTTIPNATVANIYLATEDTKAYNEFMEAKPEGWNVYADITLLEIDGFRPRKGNRASWAARNTKGRAGLVALASLLVAMESTMFVLTTKSNWSTLMNHLRTNIVDPRCGNCTRMIDLRPGVW